ncbi:MAG TPA: HhH-GPD-type base excision DNA repair protein [Jatrophihabitantaceae bacterium]|jgi:uncharacterized HhH-GPD family protein|nr:HhH-GPD-type base excision DNA repair protein [Jatrophihabitantaceae bacterium]
MYLASTSEANELLERDPLALLVGMLLDQQIPMEKAFTSPYVLRERLGHDLHATELASYDPAAFEEIFTRTPALHRFPAAMAKRVQLLASILVDRYDGDAAAVWTSAASGDELIAHIGELPGFGTQKARMFAALLGKQLKVRPKGWQEAADPYSAPGTFRSVADVVDAESLAKVKWFKQQAKAAARAAKES